ncbi:MAG: SDR family oxidoreductase, partial [Betaproteobacteria bacterium]|nr:SDR family oxidoreductase [Betaproteobacteria bacterium]
MQRVLITGGSGLLALNWACCMRDSWEPVLALHSRKIRLTGARCEFVDLESVAALKQKIAAIQPDLVVHAAGLTSVDLCEEQPAAAMHANAELARNVAAATNSLNVRLIHISTDHLFDGSKSLYTENDAPAPINVYARTKLQAELWVQQENPAALLVRTNFFGWGHRHRQSFSDWIIASLRAGKPVTMFDNVFFTPILADALVRAAHELAAKNERGIVNLGGDERISKYEFALQLARAFDLPVALIQRGKLSRNSLVAR